MAKDDAAPESAPPKSKKKLIIIIVAAVLALALVGGAAFFLLGKKPDAAQQAEHGDEAEADEEAHPPVYEKLDTFTVNLSDGETFLQAEINLKLADAKLSEKLKTRMPEVKDSILRLLSVQSPEELATVEGKDKLAGEVQKAVNEILGVKKASKGVQKVLFPAFIIQ